MNNNKNSQLKELTVVGSLRTYQCHLPIRTLNGKRYALRVRRIPIKCYEYVLTGRIDILILKCPFIYYKVLIRLGNKLSKLTHINPK
jgi:hypothetical protein